MILARLAQSARRHPWETGLLVLLAATLAALLLLPKPWNPEAANAIAAAAERDRPPPVQAAIDLTLWWAFLGAAMVLAGAWLFRRLWLTEGPARLLPPPHPVPRTVVAAIGLAVVGGALMRAPLLDHSFWNDEEVTIQDYAWGTWEVDGQGQSTFHPVPWRDTVFYNRDGSNHPLNSILTRITLQTAALFNPDPPGHFSERSARTIPFAMSLVTIALFGLLLARSGWPLAAVAVVAILALHPWHIRYSVEIRGYSIMFAAVLASLLFLFRALESGHRRHWLGFAVCQAVYVAAFGGSLYVAIAVNLVAATWLITHPARRAALPKLVAWSALSALPVAILLAPSLPQFAFYLARDEPMITFGPGWFTDLFSHLTAGIQPVDRAPSASNTLTLDMLGTPRREILLYAMPIAALAGIAAALWRASDPRIRLLAAMLPLAFLFGYSHNRLAGNPTFPWHLMFVLLAFVFGIASLVQSRRILASGAAWFLLVIPYLLAILPIGLHLGKTPRQPIRETAAILRDTAPTFGILGDTEAITATFGTSNKRLLTYDPAALRIRNTDELEELMQRAADENRTLRVAFCGRLRALASPPQDPVRMLVDTIELPSSGFTRIGNVQGMEELFSYHVFEFQPDDG